MENERDVSRNASSPDATSQVGFCSGSWCLSGTAQPASAPAGIHPLPWGKSSLSSIRRQGQKSVPISYCFWLCHPGTVAHPSICQASTAEPLPASPGCCPCVLSLLSPAW